MLEKCFAGELDDAWLVMHGLGSLIVQKAAVRCRGCDSDGITSYGERPTTSGEASLRYHSSPRSMTCPYLSSMSSWYRVTCACALGWTYLS